MFLYLYKCLKRHVCSAPGKGMMKSAGAGGGGTLTFVWHSVAEHSETA